MDIFLKNCGWDLAGVVHLVEYCACTEKSLIQLLVKAYSRVECLIPSGRLARRQLADRHLSPSPFPSL